MKFSKAVFAMATLLFVMVACASEVSRTTTLPTTTPSTETPTPQPTATSVPTPTATPLPTATATPIPIPTPTPIPTATPKPAPDPLPERDNSQLPHVFVGEVTIDGAPAPDGTEVSVWLTQYDKPIGTGTSIGGNYSVLAHQHGNSSFGGRMVIFKVNGEVSDETTFWEKGGATILEVPLN